MLRAGGVSLRRRADRFATPLYLYDAERIPRGVDRFASAFSGVPLLPAVEMAGACGFAMASNYNGRPRPVEVLIEGGEEVLVRERESLEDLMRRETIPPLPAEPGIRDQG